MANQTIFVKIDVQLKSNRFKPNLQMPKYIEVTSSIIRKLILLSLNYDNLFILDDPFWLHSQLLKNNSWNIIEYD